MALRPSLNYISLCTGGGGLDLGVELAIPDARPIVLVEREAFAVATLVSAMENGLMAQAPVWSDVRTFNGRPWRGLVDGVIGGIPCQPHSVAGKRLGAKDERDLWADARRIIVQSGAWWCLIENVQGMLSTGGAERVWSDLRRLGFEVEGGLFTSAEVGAPHERKRVFILAVRDVGNADGARLEGRTGGKSDECAGERLARAAGDTVGDTSCVGRRERWTEPVIRGGRDAAASNGGAVADADINRERKSQRCVEKIRGWVKNGRCTMANAICRGHDRDAEDGVGAAFERTAPEQSGRDDLPLYPPGPDDLDAWRAVFDRAPRFEPAIRRMADGVAGRLDQLRMLGNGVNPLQAAYALRTLGSRLARRSAAVDQLVRMTKEVT